MSTVNIIMSEIKKNGSVLGFDADWQEPARTEKHAFDLLFENGCSRENFIYFGFPWATLFDGLARETDIGDKLKRVLEEVGEGVAGNRIVTVCQHIKFRDYLKYFRAIGITDIFASHAERGETTSNGINIHAFPLFPAQGTGATPHKFSSENFLSHFLSRKLKYSFVGAYSSKYYLTNSRELIFKLPESENVLIKERAQWHFEKRVYDEQVYGKSLSEHEVKEETSNANEYIEIMENTQFSLCPSGTGPNSIRLWEAIEFGSIPIILADNLLLPGSQSLWEDACLIVPETELSVSTIPELINSVLADEKLIRSKLKALEKLKNLYGLNNFVTDILTLFETSHDVLDHKRNKKSRVILDFNCSHENSVEAWCDFVSTVYNSIQKEVEVFICGVEPDDGILKGIKSNISGIIPLCDLAIDWRAENVATIGSSATLSKPLMEKFDVIRIIANQAPKSINTSLSLPLFSIIDKQMGIFKGQDIANNEWKPICTIITSMFNGDDYLDCFLENTEAFEEYEDIEHFIVRPNSPGREHLRLLNFVAQNPSVVYVWFAKDPGLYDVWNSCINLSSADYLTNANIDDGRSPRHIKKLVAVLTKHSEADVVSSALKVSDEMNLSWSNTDGLPEWYKSDKPKVYHPRDLIKKSNGKVIAYNLPHCMPVWRASMHALNGYFDEKQFGPSADWEFWLRCGQNGSKLLMQGEALGLYYRAPMSYWRRNADAPNYDEIIAKIYANSKGEFLLDTIAKKAYQLVDTIMSSLKYKDYLRFAESYRVLLSGFIANSYQGKALENFIVHIANKIFGLKNSRQIFSINVINHIDCGSTDKIKGLESFLLQIMQLPSLGMKYIASDGSVFFNILNELYKQTSSILPIIMLASIYRKTARMAEERYLLNFAHTKNSAEFWEMIQRVYLFSLPLRDLVSLIDNIPDYCSKENFEDAEKIYFFPDYTHGNPYQKLLYNGLQDKGTSLEGINDIALLVNEVIKNKNKHIVHIHWLNILFKNVDPLLHVEVANDFISAIAKLQERGYKVYWTVHNRYNHDAADLDFEKSFRKNLALIVDKVFVHHPVLLPHLSEWLPSEANIEFVEHGNYIGHYPNSLNDEECRKRLNLDDDDIIISVLGQIRPYKMLFKALEPLNTAMIKNCKLKLIIAGKISCDKTLKALSELPAEQLILVDSFIPDEDLQLYINAAHFILLSYKDILTSGSLFQALSFSKPVIAPYLGSIPSYVVNDFNGFTYDNNNELTQRLNAIGEEYVDKKAVMEVNSMKTVNGLEWL
jgi:glycosyltransferase involved in cell wall biosynthesis